MPLRAVGKEVWRGARLAQRLNEAGAGGPTVQEHLRKLKLVQSLRKRKVDWSEIQELVGISRATRLPVGKGPGTARTAAVCSQSAKDPGAPEGPLLL